MNKTELKEALHARLEQEGFPSPSMAQTGRNVDYLFDIIVDTLSEKEDVAIQGVGSFTVVTRKARKARNVRTGEPIDVPEHLAVKFKPSANIKNRINA